MRILSDSVHQRKIVELLEQGDVDAAQREHAAWMKRNKPKAAELELAEYLAMLRHVPETVRFG